MLIRAIREDDLPGLIAIASHMHSQSPIFKRHEFVPEKVASHFIHAMGSADWLAVVAIDDGPIVGALLGEIVPVLFSNGFMAEDRGIYTPYRGEGIGKALITAYVDWARRCGADPIVIRADSGINEAATTVSLTHLGFIRAGMTFHYGEH